MIEQLGIVEVQIVFNDDNLKEDVMSEMADAVMNDLDSILQEATERHLKSLGYANKLTVNTDIVGRFE